MIWILLSCGQSEPDQSAFPKDELFALEIEEMAFEDEPTEGAIMTGGAPGAPPPAPSAEAAPADRRERADLSRQGMMSSALGALLDVDSEDKADGTIEKDSTTVRSWFPETFIFEPLIVTDSDGHASHNFTIPDRLTTWRLLGLAHNRSGLTAGATHEILGTLPQYIDPVFPPFMRLGDKIFLPIMASNTTSSSIKSTLNVQATGGKISKNSVVLNIPTQGSKTVEIPLESTELGQMWIEANLTGVDAVKDDVKVYPVGQRKQKTEQGVLTEEHIFEWAPPSNALPLTTNLQLSIYPGAVGFFRSELRQSTSHSGWNGNAYSIVLAYRAKTLFEKLGISDSLGDLQKHTEQHAQQLYIQLMNEGLRFQVDAIEAFLAVPDNIVMKRTGRSLANLVADAQLPDGTFSQATTVQRLLVEMAKVAIIFKNAAEMEPELEARAARVIQLINQGIPRLWKQSSDPYTAAWLYKAGLGTEEERAEWKSLVHDSAKSVDNTWILELPDSVVGPEGLRPTTAEFHALGLAVLSDRSEIQSSLLGSVLTSYRPGYGWGNHNRNRLILDCLEDVAQEAFPDEITIKIYENDLLLTQLDVNNEQLKDLIHLELPISTKPDSQWRLESNPPVPNMSFTANFSHYEPIKETAELDGIGINIKRPSRLKVNTPTELPVTISLPRNTDFELNLSLPTGVKITPAGQSWLELNHNYTIIQTDEKLKISGVMGSETLLNFNVEIIAQFKGVLSGGAHVLKHGPHERVLAPQKWTIQ